MNENNTSTPFMTSPIGDLTLDSDGLRKAIDEIARCHTEIKKRDEYIKELEHAIGEIRKELEHAIDKVHKES